MIPESLARLEGDGPALAAHRRGELAGATATLGVTHHLLGASAPGEHPTHRDSGMPGSAAAAHPRAWAGVPLEEAAEAVGAVIDAVRPDVVVTYDAGGGYGHPDHVRTHEATRVAAAARGVTVLGTLTPLSWATEDAAWLARHVPHEQGWVVPGDGNPYAANVVPDDVVTHAVVDPAVLPVQTRALAAHATQVVVGEGWYALSNRYVFRLAGREGYAVLDPATGRPLPGGSA